MSPVCVLIGPPGAGKTTVGTALAKLLNVEFRDTDRDIETATAKSIADIFVEDSEEVFRELEVEAVSRALAEHDGVLALGGGAVLSEVTQRTLSNHMVAFLDVSLPHATKRVGMHMNRPLLMGNVRSQLKKMMDTRRPIYESLADITILTDENSPDEIAAMIAERIQS